MQVRTGTAPRAPHIADDVASLDCLPFADGPARHVGVPGCDAAPVLQEDAVAVPVFHTRKDDRAFAGRINGRPGAGADVWSAISTYMKAINGLFLVIIAQLPFLSSEQRAFAVDLADDLICSEIGRAHV